MIPRLKSAPTSPLNSLLVAELRVPGFKGELSVAYSDRNVLATDNSICQLTPQAIAFPASIADLELIARLAADLSHPAPRGGGTGTNGQSLSDGVLVDVSHYMNKILGVDPREWASVPMSDLFLTLAQTEKGS